MFSIALLFPVSDYFVPQGEQGYACQGRGAIAWRPSRVQGASCQMRPHPTKIRLLSWGSMSRVDTTLDLSPKAEKGMILNSLWVSISPRVIIFQGREHWSWLINNFHTNLINCLYSSVLQFSRYGLKRDRYGLIWKFVKSIMHFKIRNLLDLGRLIQYYIIYSSITSKGAYER